MERKCLKCEGDMFAATIKGAYDVPLYVSNKKKGILETEKRSEIECYVCGTCGHIELVAKESNKLKLN